MLDYLHGLFHCADVLMCSQSKKRKGGRDMKKQPAEFSLSQRRLAENWDTRDEEFAYFYFESSLGWLERGEVAF